MPGAHVWKKVLGRVSLLIGAPLGDLGRGVRLPGTLKFSCRRALAMEHLTLWELYEGNLEGGLPCWGP